MSKEKKYYSEYEADTVLNPLNIALIEAIKAENPVNVFEFGCGTGKHLRELDIPGMGIDISERNISKAIQLRKRESETYLVGDENLIRLIKSELSFTCSVICHMNPTDAKKTIEDLKAISQVIILAETQETPSKFYWNHDYQSWGFVPSGGWISPGNLCFYRLWIWRATNE